ncbi:hypothetical protein LTR04_004785 [Oleoguttula sp. CCFEE 6159]|nr:hypothetical protein LTR04_004785 [Oleoguttula sp. CCFEE 6159]
MPAARAGKGETYADLDQSQASAKQKRKLEAHDVLDDHVRDKAAGASPLKSTAVDGKSRATVQDTEVKSPKPSGDGCIPQGLTSPVKGASEQFTLGGRSDSVYEYLPKEFLLLGGVVDQYKTMYEYSMEAVIDKVLFRPMVPGERDILVPGRYASNAQGEDGQLTPESEHLACFAGGMFALGAKIFNRKGDLDIARRLTDGCVWAYESTTTGIMPELYQAVACESRYECSWNETKWWDVLDPYRAARTKALAPFPHLAPSTSIALVPTSAAVRAQPAALTSAAVHVDLEKRQFDEVPGAIAAKAFGTPVERPIVATGNILGGAPAVYTSPPPPLSHEEYVKAKISEERLPPGFKTIESVFYMYRITGDDYWREKGWKMFMAIQKYTRVEYGYSAIDDVTKSAPELKDEMESFWLAETLKYFYLLFSDPELVSLDDWVLLVLARTSPTDEQR